MTTAKRAKQMLRMWEHDHSMKDIATSFGISRQAVSQLLMKYHPEYKEKFKRVCEDCGKVGYRGDHVIPRHACYGTLCPKCFKKAQKKLNSGWSRHYDKCVSCGRTDRREQSYGRCCVCYSYDRYHSNANGRKDKAKKWYKDTIEQRRAVKRAYYHKNKKKFSEYYKKRYWDNIEESRRRNREYQRERTLKLKQKV